MALLPLFVLALSSRRASPVGETVTSHQDFTTDTDLRDISFVGINDNGAFSMSGGSISVYNCNFTNCQGDNGGAASFKTVKKATIVGCFVENMKAGNGGAFYFENVEDASISSSNFSTCYANVGVWNWKEGGGVCVRQGAIEISNTNFSDCRAVYGGACYFENARAVGKGLAILQCIADYGGGIYCQVPSESLIWTGCSHVECTARKQDGGGVSVPFKEGVHLQVARVEQCVFDGCTAAVNHDGHAVALRSLELVFSNCSVVNIPEQQVGKAVVLKGSSIISDGVVLRNNSCYGLELELAIGAWMTVTNMAVIGNRMCGISCTRGTVGFRGLQFCDNVDSAIEITPFASFADCVFKGNRGGWSVVKSFCEFDNCLIADNDKFKFIVQHQMNFNNSLLRNNTERVIDATAPVSFDNISVEDSRGECQAISIAFTNYQDNFTITNMRFLRCQTDQDGSCILVTYCRTFTVLNCSFEYCSTTKRGGGLFAAKDTCQFLHVENSVFRRCNSTGHGSGVYAGVPTLVTSCEFEHNIGASGALYCAISLRIDITGTVFLFNTCNGINNDVGSALATTQVTELNVNDCLFVADMAMPGAAVCVFLSGSTENENATFGGCCFNTSISDSQNGAAHIYGQYRGTVKFNLPMCFDKSKEESLYFDNGQDPGAGMNIFNCIDCEPPGPSPTTSPPIPTTEIPTPTYTVIPTATPTYWPSPTQSSSPTPTSSPSPTPTSSPSPTPTRSPSQSPTSPPSPTPTSSPTPTEAPTSETLEPTSEEPTFTPVPTEESHGLSTGAIVGIVFGVILFIIILILLIMCILRGRNKYVDTNFARTKLLYTEDWDDLGNH